MIFLIISIIVFIALMWIWIENLGMALLLGSTIGLFFGVIIWVLGGGLIGAFLPTTTEVETKPIYALTDSTSIEGNKFLMSGYVKEGLVYRYITKTTRGKHIEEIKANSVYINEGNYTPHLKIYNQVLAKDWYYWFACPLFAEQTYYEFYVPDNSMINEYEIDLE